MGIDLSSLGAGINNFFQDSKNTSISNINLVKEDSIELFDDLENNSIENYDIVSSNDMNTISSISVDSAIISGMFGATSAYVANVSVEDSDMQNSLIAIVMRWWNETILPTINAASSFISSLIESTMATVATFHFSLIEGVLLFGEALADLLALFTGVVGSIGTGLYDGYQYIRSLITGDEWESATLEFWEKGIMEFVSTESIKTIFDSFYEETSLGNWLAENSVWFDGIRGIGNGIGYIAGVILLTIATFGIGGTAASSTSTVGINISSNELAGMSGALGFSTGAEKSWADGANLVEGLGFGTLNALLEGLSFFVGTKVAGFNPFKGQSGNMLNSLSHVAIDGAEGGIEDFFQSILAVIYKDGYYDESGAYIEFTSDQNIFDRASEVFDDCGGQQIMLTNAILGSGGSLIGEVFDLTKVLKNKNVSFNEPLQKVETYVDNSTLNYNKTDDLDILAVEKNLDYNNFEELMEKANLIDYSKKWNKEHISKILHHFFDSKVGSEYIDNIIETMHIIPKDEWEEFKKIWGGNVVESNALAFQHHGEIYCTDVSAMHDVIHEMFHAMSEKNKRDVINPNNGKTFRMSGILEWYYDASSNSHKITNMADETLTEYLSSKYSDNKIYAMYDSELIKLWEKIDLFLFQKYGKNTILIDSYLNNDTSKLKEFFNENAFEGAYEKFSIYMNDSWKNTDEITSILDEIEKNVMPSNVDKILSIITKIFGGNI